MVNNTKNRVLHVYMNEKRVGTLEKKGSRAFCFSYDATWLAMPGARPISLSLPLLAKEFTARTVYSFFDNLLPDNPQIRSRIQAYFHAATNEPFDLLTVIGKDCVGAIQLRMPDDNKFSSGIQCAPLSEKKIASLLRNIKTNPLGMTHDENDFRISIAGAQEKSALLYWRKKWMRPIGSTPTTHIFKLPIGVILHQKMDLSDSCENEWLCAQIARAFGLPTASCDIGIFDGVKALIVKRFDRKLSRDRKKILRLPQEDMCQALGIPPDFKYQSDGGPGIKDIMKLLLGSATPDKDREFFFGTQVLFWLLAAIDGHAKNFSIFLEPGGQFRLTPLYDIMSAYPLIANKQLQAKKIKMAMALEGKNKHYHWHEMQRRHFLSAAKTARFSPEKAEEIINSMLSKVDDVICVVTKELPKRFPRKIAKPVFDGMRLARDKLK
ncbi:MAG: serine/threonine protein kinase [Gammaproteobacteria bacterium RIFCSPHIGHO2_12_FULL_38_11]|nr:MAG: serine/threonine protein kinase [Gammaproteobacteria bacterium RIFCSPHIGHO2_12_FULL_38_11]